MALPTPGLFSPWGLPPCPSHTGTRAGPGGPSLATTVLDPSSLAQPGLPADGPWEKGWSRDMKTSLAFAEVLVGTCRAWPVTEWPRVPPLFPGGINLTETLAWLSAAQPVTLSPPTSFLRKLCSIFKAYSRKASPCLTSTITRIFAYFICWVIIRMPVSSTGIVSVPRARMV